jgi:hypothetical protein
VEIDPANGAAALPGPPSAGFNSELARTIFSLPTTGIPPILRTQNSKKEYMHAYVDHQQKVSASFGV